MARKNRRGRPITGILVLDKPQGCSSNQALQKVKHLYFANKAGHTGSLDPLATGVLPICFGEATKFSRYLLDSDKSYHTTIVLGFESSTEDADGVLKFVADTSSISKEDVEKVAESLLGDQMQVPPMYSALKHKGQRLYNLARQGVEVERAARKINIQALKLVAFRAGLPITAESFNSESQSEGLHSAIDRRAVICEIELELTVTKGTYIRSLAAEIGRLLGVGAYVLTLRRTQASVFDLQGAVSIELLESLKQSEKLAEMDQLLRPITEALQHIPDVILDDNTSFYLQRGNPVQVPQAPLSGVVKLLLDNGEFVGIGEIDDQGLVAPKRLVVSQHKEI